MEPFKPDVMLKQVSDLGNLLRTSFLEIDAHVREAFSTEILKRIHHVYAIGDGDSLHAALAAEMAFGEFAGVAYYPREAMRFLEYGADYLSLKYPASNLVLGISASGGSIRVVQALERAKSVNENILVAGLVGNPDSKVADVSKIVISTQIPSFGKSPGIRTFAASFMGLIALAIRIGEAKHKLTFADVAALHQEILGLSDIIDNSASAALEPAKTAAKALAGADFFSFVGSGPSYGIAVFSSAKVVEAAGIFAVGQDLEEWAHVEGLAYPLAFPVYMIAPPGKGYWRAEKLANYVTMLGHPLVTVGHQNNNAIKSISTFFIPVMGDVRECFSPLAYHTPASLFACFLAQEKGRLPFMLDNKDVLNRSQVITHSIKTKESGEV